jgi:thiamine biosynthesis lipoprotein
MGGTFTYKVFPQSNLRDNEVEELIKVAHSEVQRIESKFTEFHPSIIEDINNLAGIEECEVDRETMELILQSKKYHEVSQGLFDITYSARNKLWRKNGGAKLGLIERLQLKSLVDFSKVKIDRKRNTIYLPYKKMRIGFGGIGKGYAVDRAYEILFNEGLENFSVNGSGDMRVHSHESAPRAWKIGIRNPFNKDPNVSAGLVQLRIGSVSTSGSYIQNFNDHQSETNHHIHIKNPQFKTPPPLSCTVLSEKCIDSDVWATIAMAMDIQKAIPLLEKNHLAAIIIDATGKTFLTSKAIDCFRKV